MSKRGAGGLRGVAGAAWGVLLGVALIAPNASAQAKIDPAGSRKMLREISVLEKVIDQMLLDSKNILVYSHENNTRGLYLDEFGVLFSFQASLVNKDDGDMPWMNLEDFKITHNADGNIVIVPGPRSKQKKEDGEAEAPPAPGKTPKTPKTPKAPEPPQSPRAWLDKRAGNQAELYEAGKAEIIETLLDYGDTMNSLQDNQWLAIAAFLKGSDFFIDNRIARLLVKARMSDLRAYAAGRLNHDQMTARVVQEEY